ncbi:nucleotidyltransferase family protein, partial [Nocardia sp. NPDC060259]|uniref:nucleotidyltransferase family protein n=1 Tax=Nocardia sp. NPDC060259 TaxID=3347088 RepID=UPI00365B932F
MAIDFDALMPQLRALCEKYDVVELSVFGSVARGSDGPDSDVDLLYLLKPDTQIGLEFFGFQEELEELLGRRVDVVPKKYLQFLILDAVLEYEYD